MVSKSLRLLLVLAASSLTQVGGVAGAGTMWGVSTSSATSAVTSSTAVVPPASVTATCGGVKWNVTVSWSSAPYSNDYALWSSTSPTSGYSVVASGLTGTSYSYSIPQHVATTYYYEMSDTVGGTWGSTNSAASAGRTFAKSGHCS